MDFEEDFEGSLRNKDLGFDDFRVFFTGVPFSGKSTVAKVLQHRYGMVRIESDRLREIKDSSDVDIDVYNYISRLHRDCSFSNGRIVQDSSIDRMYEDIIPYLEEEDIPYFIIKMPVPEDMDKRAKEKGGIYLENWQSSTLEEFLEDHQNALEDLEVDFRFGEDGGLKALLEKLDKILSRE